MGAAPPTLAYDAQSELCRFVATQLHGRAAGAFELARGEGEPFRWRSGEREHTGLPALLEAADRAQLRWRDHPWLTGTVYRWALSNRVAARWLGARLWGRARPTWQLSRWLFLRVLGLCYLAAFLSLLVQVRGLFGEQGLVPVRQELAAVASAFGGVTWRVPTVFWLAQGDGALVAAAALGAVLSAVFLAGFGQRWTLAVMAALYLSFIQVGRPFLAFQWDAMLIEAAFLGVFLAPRGAWRPVPAEVPRAPRWLLRWLLFRVMFLSGLVKLTSPDGAWRDLSALGYHFWSQPLPSPGGYWLAQLPPAVLSLMTAAALAIELVLPFCALGPRPLRRIACFGFVTLMALITLTGSYGFLTLLTAGLCALLLDDGDWARVLPSWALRRRVPAPPPRPAGPPGRARRWSAVLTAALFALLFVETVSVSVARVRRRWDLPAGLAALNTVASPFLVANPYGKFEVMTRDRVELSVEGSADGVHWRAYPFRYKPQAEDPAPSSAALHLPRLDWLMWFAALGTCEDNPWLWALQARLLEGSEPVLGLFEDPPFQGAPPKWVRVQAARYRFAPPGEGKAWRVEPLGAFCPPSGRGEAMGPPGFEPGTNPL